MGVIKFGIDGWRGKVGDGFTFNNVRLFAQGYCNHLKKQNKLKKHRVVVNYCTGFLSRKFAQEVAKILSLNGVLVYIPQRDVPLAAISLSVVQKRCDGGISFSLASNHHIYCILKVFNGKGSPALPSETSLIEKEIEVIRKGYHFRSQYQDDGLIQNIDARTLYIKYLNQIIDFNLIRNSGIKIIVDNQFGTSREYLDSVLSDHKIDVISIHNFPYTTVRNQSFSFDQDSLNDLSRYVLDRKADIGLATDIEGDRFGIIDSNGRFLCSNTIMPPLIEYLIKVKKMEGGIVKSVSTTNNIKRVADFYLRKVYVAPVGFKYLAQMMSIRKAFIGVESTNGASLNKTIQIKDGILFNLLVTEMLAHFQLKMDKILRDFYLKFPRLYDKEISVIKNKKREKKLQLLSEGRKSLQRDIPHNKMVLIDGIKFEMGDSWLLIRESGRENVIRIYAESPSMKQTRELIRKGRSLIG